MEWAILLGIFALLWGELQFIRELRMLRHLSEQERRKPDGVCMAAEDAEKFNAGIAAILGYDPNKKI